MSRTIALIEHHAEGDAAADLLERRWFASLTAVRTMQTECEVLREVMELAESSWRRARGELARLEALRDALGEELAERDFHGDAANGNPGDRRVSSAA
jgi:hypothetical protein